MAPPADTLALEEPLSRGSSSSRIRSCPPGAAGLQLGSEAMLQEIRRSMQVTIDSISLARHRIDERVLRALALIDGSRKKVLFVGVGKSGHIARKLSATFSSTGTPAVYLNASEALHGDLGMIEGGECAVLISHSGTTQEILAVVPALRRLGVKLIGILGNVQSPLASQVDCLIDASVLHEADCLRLAPTASTSVALAIGDALASALMFARGFSPQDFFRFHPGGQLGRSLSLTAAQVMRARSEVPTVRIQDGFLDILRAISDKALGATCVVSEGDQLLGLVTDGDLRRHLERHGSFENTRAGDIMNPHPDVVAPATLLREVLELMRERGKPRSFVPVVEEGRRLAGAVWYYDVVR